MMSVELGYSPASQIHLVTVLGLSNLCYCNQLNCADPAVAESSEI